MNEQLDRPEAPSGAGLVLTHGASGSSRSPFLIALAGAFSARGVTVLRYDLPYRQASPTAPPRPEGGARDRDGLRTAVKTLRAMVPGPVFLGGQSYGGRQASMLAASEPALADALLLLCYPLHPPRRRTELRTAHLPELRTPALFAHGTRDPFGSLEEIEAARDLIPARTALFPIEGAAHDLYRAPRRAGPDVVGRIVEAFLAFVAEGSGEPNT
ncbi:MAG: alpha/beta hydrolase [Candidatus Rokuibacteriota bacterium]|nr:MAG: alpha/beta hydrolase [Candidatus Rokubacteria bacterium]